jgi:acyl-CoA reductase-like NAD-dependent aldehyde dehydrogenase
VLQHCVGRFTERFDELALALCIEAGKPIRDARGEVTRLIDTFRMAAEESVRSAPAPSSAPSTSRSTWPRTRPHRRSRRAVRSC